MFVALLGVTYTAFFGTKQWALIWFQYYEKKELLEIKFSKKQVNRLILTEITQTEVLVKIRKLIFYPYFF
ncbi:hypothetical protein DDV96_09830 [Marixanthomonas spongiae]|uniref:Uncharacterized protein n=1 Tax=Marixanthomonas spongiae TaxID=2174845 RepID=A0A2U0HZ37_9FLAO|nr:hypothetical protein DDV96_09830 [Marixanthomonas spongiae]